MSSHFSQWALRVLWLWRFFAFTHCICSSVCVCPDFQYIYISLSLYAVCACVLLFELCVMLPDCESHRSTAQQTNQFVSQWPPADPTCPALWLAAHTPSAPLALMPPPPSNTVQVNSASRLQMQLHLNGLQQNATDLRKQLSQLRKMQVYNISIKKIHLSDVSS